MQDFWSIVFSSGYVKSALGCAALWLSKSIWLSLLQSLQQWVQSAPERRRADNERDATRAALSASDKEAGDRACRVLEILTGASRQELTSSTAADPPAESTIDEAGPSLQADKPKPAEGLDGVP
ncbi:hypothetical protein ACFWN2_06650 [Lentzea sp. NPDC058436]|uniref:hypothetical protein n=1 Tax=Lentzea sp. NPDC058436 TaxID=3346499 RepID=UPI00364EAAC6